MMCLREDMICPALDQWIARAFAPERLTATLTALTHAAAASDGRAPEVEQARRAVRKGEKRLSHYRAALAAGAGPAVLTQWINEARICTASPRAPSADGVGEGEWLPGAVCGVRRGVVVAGREESSSGSLVGWCPFVLFQALPPAARVCVR